MATAKIRSANAASTSSLAPTLPRTIQCPSLTTLHQETESTQLSISLHKALELPRSIKDRIYALFNSNMAPLSQTSSLEYTESSKREELFDETGRFLLLRTNRDRDRDRGTGFGRYGYGHGEDFNVDMPGALPMTPESGLEDGEGEGEGEVLGYVSFRFDTEETLGSRDAEVIYCYELQLDPSVRKMGLAKVLVNEMESIGRKRRMDKAMLTCLKANTTALSFYRKQGYEPDEIDPTRMEEDNFDQEEEGEDEWEEVGHEVDYVILSKSLR